MLYFNLLPFPVLETERLILRATSLKDAPALFGLRSNKDAMKFIGRPLQKDVQEAEEFITNLIDMQNKETCIFWIITFKDNPEKLIGNICYWNIKKDHNRAEIGYMLHPDHWQQGIMKEVIQPVIDYGFNTMKLHSIEAHIKPDNAASEALLLSANFIQKGYFKENFFFNGMYTDSAVFSLVNEGGK